MCNKTTAEIFIICCFSLCRADLEIIFQALNHWGPKLANEGSLDIH